MVRLYRRGFLERGLLPLKKRAEGNRDMIASFREPIFREIVSDLRSEVEKDEEGQSREELVRSLESFIRHPGILNPTQDMLDRARVAGGLLESVLKLLVRDRFDPVGCIILAQQDRETKVDQVPPLPEDDVE
jgi:hypothetical protein